MRKVIGVGETVLDIIFKNDQPYQAVPGGSVFNGLVSLGRLGVPISFISELGNDRVGQVIRNFMTENNISTDYVDCFPDGKSPVSLAFLDEHQNADYTFYKDYPNQRLEVPLPPIREDDIFIFGSYYSLNPVLRERMVEFLEYARDRKAIIYYDLNFRKAHAHEAIFLTPTILDNFEYADIIRGSDEDFLNIFGKTDMEHVYQEHIRFYCDRFITTHGADGVQLFTRDGSRHFPTTSFKPVSTIGAGDNFNAGILYGLLKYDIRHKDLPLLNREQWGKLISCGVDFATEVCQNYENYIPKEFAERYRNASQS
ncbi:MAG: carbohydrate kinase [Tannerellaceae bacterium]|nr:carbohydrate kinase [Tannerellaceae bacterium]